MPIPRPWPPCLATGRQRGLAQEGVRPANATGDRPACPWMGETPGEFLPLSLYAKFAVERRMWPLTPTPEYGGGAGSPLNRGTLLRLSSRDRASTVLHHGARPHRMIRCLQHWGTESRRGTPR